MDKNEEKIKEEVVEKENIDNDLAEEKQKEIEVLKQKVLELEGNYKRAFADYQNLQRRTQEQKIEIIKSASKDLVLKILPILDILILATKHFKDKSLELIISQFLKVLEEEGITKIKTVDEKFDPNTMECVTTKTGEDGKVLEEVRFGFMIYELVLRPAQVIVGKKEE